MKQKTKDIINFLKYKETSTDIAIAIGINLDNNGGRGVVTTNMFNFSYKLVNNFTKKFIEKAEIEKGNNITLQTILDNKNVISELLLSYGANKDYLVVDDSLIDFCHDKCMDLIEFRLQLEI